jgi:citrate synthase
MMASLAGGVGAFAGGLGGGGEDQAAQQLAEANQAGLSEADRAAMAALDQVRKREKLRMKPTMGVGAFG